MKMASPLSVSVLLATLSTLCLLGCTNTNDTPTALHPPEAVPATAESASQITANESSFRCIRQMTPVRHFYVDNLLGNKEGTLAAANAPKGAIYPAGSVVQLVPTEAMVKREAGFSPPTGDWEFFELEVSSTGSKIHKRGFAEVNNRHLNDRCTSEPAGRPIHPTRQVLTLGLRRNSVGKAQGNGPSFAEVEQ